MARSEDAPNSRAAPDSGRLIAPLPLLLALLLLLFLLLRPAPLADCLASVDAGNSSVTSWLTAVLLVAGTGGLSSCHDSPSS